jgi:hypothetical protein
LSSNLTRTLSSRFDELGDELASIYRLIHQVSLDNADSLGYTPLAIKLADRLQKHSKNKGNFAYTAKNTILP